MFMGEVNYYLASGVYLFGFIDSSKKINIAIITQLSAVNIHKDNQNSYFINKYQCPGNSKAYLDVNNFYLCAIINHSKWAAQLSDHE